MFKFSRADLERVVPGLGEKLRLKDSELESPGSLSGTASGSHARPSPSLQNEMPGLGVEGR